MKHQLSFLAAAALVGGLAQAQKLDTDSGVQKGSEQPGHYGASSSLAAGGSDDCTNAAASNTLVGTGTFPVNTVGATTGATPAQPQTPSTIKNDVWFYWVAPATGNARLETCGGVTVDTKVAAWLANNGTACPSGTNLAYNDDACALQSRINWSVTAGTAYFVQVGAYTEGVTYSGTFTLNVLTPPTNDVCSAPVALVGDGPHPYDTTLASTGTEGQSESLCGATTGIGRDIWFTWTASSSGQRAVSTLGGTLDTKVAVYPVGGCPTVGSALACNDDYGTATQSVASFTAVAGTTYLIQLGQDPTNTVGGGFGNFSIVDNTPPANDNCSSATVISGAGPFTFDTTWATTGTEGQGTAGCGPNTTFTKDLWYAWTASTTGQVTVSNCGQFTSTTTDTKIQVFDGAGCPTAAPLVCNDDAGTTGCAAQTLASVAVFNAVCGQTYMIHLGNYSTSLSTVTAGTFTVTEAGTPCVAGTAYCFGDGTASVACPCGNAGGTGNGCASSINPLGANLTGSGNASIAGDTLALTGSGMPNSNALYFQGTTQIAAAFGDGLRCAGGTVIRLGTKLNVGGTSTYPAAGDLSVSVRGNVTLAGSVRSYQAWYRNAAAFCTPSTFNLTNGYSVTWAP
jgi:hypothetical protein